VVLPAPGTDPFPLEHTVVWGQRCAVLSVPLRVRRGTRSPSVAQAPLNAPARCQAWLRRGGSRSLPAP